jgi:hypothetical protein
MKQRIIQSPLMRIILGLIICLAAIIIGQQLFLEIPGVSLLSTDLKNLIKGIVVSFLAIGSYAFFTTNTKRKPYQNCQ